MTYYTMPSGRRTVTMGLRSLVLLAAMLLALGCLMPTAEPEPDVATETAAEPTEPMIVHSLPAASNVRAGPHMEQAVVFQVVAGSELTVLGRNADGTWLQIAFEDQTGWIYEQLTDMDAEALAGLEITAENEDIVEIPQAPEPEPIVEADEDAPVIDAPAPEPEPEDESVATPPSESEPDMLHVTGDVVNLRNGPGTHHALAGQVHIGDSLRVTGRNADGTWLQIADPNDPDKRLWIYGALTSIDANAARSIVNEVEIPLAPTAFAAVSGGFRHTCGLRRNGAIACWGVNGYDGVSVPPAGTFTTISAGLYHNCAIRSDGTIACWGANYFPGDRDTWLGQATPPSGTFTAISSGALHTCGIRADGTVTCWGAGHANDTGENGFGQSVPPSGTFTSVSAGGIYTCGIRTDGTIDCWGELDTAPDGAFTIVNAGDHGFDPYACGVRVDGTVACWGATTTAPDGTFTTVTVSANLGYACGLRANGTIDCWGTLSTAPDGTFTAIDAGWQHACGVRTDGTVACWGDNQYGQAVPPRT